MVIFNICSQGISRLLLTVRAYCRVCWFLLSPYARQQILLYCAVRDGLSFPLVFYITLFVFLFMKWLLLGLCLSFLLACTPSGPTGLAVAPPTALSDGRLLVSVDVLPVRFGLAPVKVVVSDGLVYRTLLVDGVAHELSGSYVSDGWLSGSGSVVVWLPPGEHVVHACSCEDSFFGWRCGCI